MNDDPKTWTQDEVREAIGEALKPLDPSHLAPAQWKEPPMEQWCTRCGTKAPLHDFTFANGRIGRLCALCITQVHDDEEEKRKRVVHSTPDTAPQHVAGVCAECKRAADKLRDWYNGAEDDPGEQLCPYCWDKRSQRQWEEHAMALQRTREIENVRQWALEAAPLPIDLDVVLVLCAVDAGATTREAIQRAFQRYGSTRQFEGRPGSSPVTLALDAGAIRYATEERTCKHVELTTRGIAQLAVMRAILAGKVAL